MIKKIIDVVKIWDIDDKKHLSFKYITFNLYIKEHDAINQSAIAYIQRKTHIVENLRAKILINSDVIDLKNMIINMSIKKLFIKSCEITFLLICTSFKTHVNHITKAQYIVIISAYNIIAILFKINDIKLSHEWNYSFRLNITHVINLKYEEEIMTYILNVNIIIMYVRNVTNKSVTLFKHVKLKYIINFNKEDYYYVNSKDVHLPIDISWKKWILITAVEIIAIAILLLTID